MIREVAMRNDFEMNVFIPNLRERLYITTSTICNLRCRFCAYSKSSITKSIMPNHLFFSIIEKACDFGFTIFNVTPLIGEVLTDPDFIVKLDFLERFPNVENFSFCTNLTLADDEFINNIRHLSKLHWLSISIYGYDTNSFQRITRAKSVLFEKMVHNLSLLLEWGPSLSSHVELRIRTERSFSLEKCTPDLYSILNMLIKMNVRIRIVTDSYSNWGGLITANDLEGLDICLKPNISQKSEPCTFLFYKHTILPDGRINACSAEDGNASMIIGDLRKQSFKEIYFLLNDTYMQLISQQLKGQFSKLCQACSGYRSIHEYNYTYQFHKRPFITLNEFFGQLR